MKTNTALALPIMLLLNLVLTIPANAQVSCFSPQGDRNVAVGGQCNVQGNNCVVGASCVSGTCTIDGSTGCSAHNLEDGQDSPAINLFSDDNLSSDSDRVFIGLISSTSQSPVATEQPGPTSPLPTQPTQPTAPVQPAPPPRASLLPNFEIEVSHLNYGSLREERMLWYLGSSLPLRGHPRYATLHWTGSNHNPSCAPAIKQFFSPQTKQSEGQTIANNCSNFVVNKDGSGLEIVPIGLGCIQASNRVLNSGLGMSIENCGVGDLGQSLTNSQVLANVQIIGRAIEDRKIAEDTCIVGHYEAAPTERSDPGPNFLRAVCAELKQRGYQVKCSVLDECNPPNTNTAFSPENGENTASARARIAGLNSMPIAPAELTQLSTGIYDFEIGGYMPVKGIRKARGQEVVFYEDTNKNSRHDPGEPILEGNALSALQLTYAKVSNAVSYDLLSGWNSFSLPGGLKGQGDTAASLMKEIRIAGGQAETISRLVSGAWESYSVKDGEGYGTNFEISSGYGYALYMTSPVRIELELDLDQTREARLSSGWNFIPANNFDDSTSLLNSGQFDTVSDLYQQSFRTQLNRNGEVYGNGFTLIETKGYFIRRPD